MRNLNRSSAELKNGSFGSDGGADFNNVIDRFQDAFESIDLKFRVVFEKLVAQGDITADEADELDDILDAIDDMDEDEFEVQVRKLLGHR